MPNETYGTTLKGFDKDLQVRSFNMSFFRSVGQDGRPSSLVMGGTINVSAIITPGNLILAEMINASNKPLATGSIVIIVAQQEEIFRTIEFTNAFITSYSESYAEGGSEYPVDFVLSCETISVGVAKLDNKWPVVS